MLNNPGISIIVLNWNGEKIFPSCIASLKKTDYSPLEIVFVDNGSTDQSLRIAREYENVKIVSHKENLGFAAGNNRALPFIDQNSKYVCFLNNDIEVSPDWLNTAIPHLENNQAVGTIACRNMDFYNRSVIDGLYHYFIPYFSLARFGRGLPYQDDPLMNEPGYVVSALGSSLIVRKDLFIALGGFDESFYSYYEDADLCMRINNRGYRCLYDPKAVVYHMDQASFKKGSALSYYYAERNRLFFIKKNFSKKFIAQNAKSILCEEIRQLKSCILGDRNLKSLLSARFDAIKKLKSITSVDRGGFNDSFINDLIVRKKIPL